MTDRAPSVDEVEALARHEEAIAGLYSQFAEAFPDYLDFWNRMAKDEIDHAAWVREYRKLVEQGKSEVNRGRFRVKAIETSIRYINGYGQQARRNELSILNAVSLAVDIENALIDRKFLEIYETDDEDLKSVLNALIEATKSHRERVVSLLNDVRQSEGPAAVG